MNKICELLNIQYPIIQGGMAWVANANLASAVSNAGGLGIIAGGNAPKEIIKEEIRKCKEFTDKPFGVNVMLLSPFADEIIDLVIEENIPVITTGAGNPAKYMEKLKKANVKVIPVVPTIALAQRMEKLGADAVIVEGTEAGGHIGELTTMVLTPQVADAVNIPVIAAGGIADGRGVVAALALGAKGVQIGTRFICSEECSVHENYKNMIIKSKDRDAIVTGRSTGHPVRTLKNKLSKEVLSMEKEGINPEEIDKKCVGSLRMATIDGDIENGSFMAGQIASIVKDIKPCKKIIGDIVNQVKEIMPNIDL
ncbi:MULTISPECIES: enoyl-[acyl-carrier-protein] reductase FabK [Romboutsia]|uniref:Probable nitronate monooxygenase n=1 Tax=Romboutsia hominis TaxID=1507512 RepID=A0A2P2BTP9_9FIRM|nr:MULTISPECIES: enoyl-[acyl-carrier-protein] reductase FabK [Romboutsia]MCH1960979.1 enoyl-[acyl-carrier-protein] reductase FabK [Romboutsia hominis]MDB8804539.1 enoyl-[acyl-carrier-protein] reductase FabK [Romboutsia sp. 1001216sp1]MDB8806537.1 enoyl-[acyl-carrier-protein] reductase FabK [Romboutsia sp. 1001216sp1]MDB8810187.1 enoyl-[acyl-carrier-protein] reductase FabK [Romboutsia sp. 1001216sp1]MDB8815934.1 enoyl-[acyl-carrier-protein] reductase FabK [Romboutsia sp. 1001216sp1]